jgi:membrane associated rhomboid family serine protease
MLPFKDNLPHERFPLVTLALLALNVLAYALPGHHLALVAMLLDVLLLALLGPSLEGALGHGRFLAVCAVGALLGLELRALAGEGAAGPLAFLAGGATVAALGVYLVRFPRARVLSLVLVPFLVTIVEVPAALLLGVWTGAQLYIGLAG